MCQVERGRHARGGSQLHEKPFQITPSVIATNLIAPRQFVRGASEPVVEYSPWFLSSIFPGGQLAPFRYNVGTQFLSDYVWWPV